MPPPFSPSVMKASIMRSRSIVTKQAFHSLQKRTPELAYQTGPLDELNAKAVLVIADIENLSYSARDLGYNVNYAALARRILQTARRAAFHGFFSRESGDSSFEQYLQNVGWTPHPRNIQRSIIRGAPQRFANSDNFIGYGAGFLAARKRFDAVIVATGDGALGCDIAAALKQYVSRPIAVTTMSLPGSTSWRLRAGDNPDIICNIEIGLDCLRLPAGRERVSRTGLALGINPELATAGRSAAHIQFAGGANEQ